MKRGVLLILGALAFPSQASAQPPAQTAVPPALTSDASVAYPDGATGDATVVLTLTIDEGGSVTSATPLEAREPFSSLAASAAMAWKFQPATRDGKPVVSRIRMEVVFLQPPPAMPTPGPPAIEKKKEIEEVIVRGVHVEPSRTVSFSRAEVRLIPGTFGDPFRAVEIMPGVTPIVSGLPFFFVRGAPPGDVGYFLDGIRVPYLFHVGAGPSVVHPALMDRVDLYPGGYPARFGRFSGGIVAGETVDAPATPHGEGNIRLFDAGALVDVPFDHGRGEVLAGGRYSYTGFLLSVFAPGTLLDYWDYQFRAGYDITPRDRISVFSFGAYDFLAQKTPTTTQTLFGAQFHRVDVRYDHRLGQDGMLRTAVLGGIDLTDIGSGRNIRDRLAGVRSELTYRLSPHALLRAGADMQLDTYDIQLGQNDLGPAMAAVAAFFPTRTDLSMGARADVVLGITRALEVTPGVRFDYYGSQGATALGIDPRLALRTTITNRVKALAALGIAHQPPSFVIPVPGFQPGGLKGGLQTAVQESLGLEVELGQGTTATATVFHNGFFDLSDALSVSQPRTGGCAPGTFPDDSLAGDRGTQPTGNGSGCGVPRFTPGTVGSDRSGGGGQASENTNSKQFAQAFEVRATGTSYGLELMLKRKLTSRFGGFFSYTLSRSTRTANNQTNIASFDRTHVLNAAAAYDLGRGWRAGARVTFYTGLPKAPTPDSSGDRLDPFFRLDLRMEKKWQLSKNWWISLVAEWMNVTMSKESVGTQCTLSGCQEQKIGPITIPSLGLEGGF